METKKRPHLLLFPFPAQGHMLSLLDLAHSLATHGLAVTLLTTQNEPLLHSLLTTASSQGLHIQPLILPLPPTNELPPHSQDTAQFPLHGIPNFIYSFKELTHPIEQWFLQQQDENNGGFGPPICMISDFFLGWTQDTAAKLGIPRIVFCPSGALGTAVFCSLWKHLPHEGVDSDDGEFSIPDLPHPLIFRKSQMPRMVQNFKRSHPVFEFLRYTMDLNVKSWGTIINTFDDLESLYVHHIEKVSGRPVWSVGPLLPSDVLQGKHEPNVVRGGNPNSTDESTCLEWLDSRKEKSVVYVCFGSQAELSQEQIHALAAGLEASEESFIWVIKNSSTSGISDSTGGLLPQGFEERTKERGLVIRGWAPQLLILSHPSVGGFLSHCGWNSVLESITLGVPLITWPMSADQHSNALLLVEYLGVGVRLCEGISALPDRDGIKMAVKRVVGGEGAEAKRVEELSKAAGMAVQEDGSSWRNLEAFVAEMRKLQSS